MSEEDNTIFGYSTSRIVALLTPVLATVMGGLAAWLFQHFPGLDSIVDEESTAAGLTTGGIWIATAFLTYAISHKWLDGLSKWERRIFGALPGDGDRPSRRRPRRPGRRAGVRPRPGRACPAAA